MRAFMRLCNFKRVDTRVKTKSKYSPTVIRYYDDAGHLVMWERHATGTWGIDVPAIEAYILRQSIWKEQQ